MQKETLDDLTGSSQYLQELSKNPAFGAVGSEFSLDELRKGMGARQAPANSDVECIRSQIDDRCLRTLPALNLVI